MPNPFEPVEKAFHDLFAGLTNIKMEKYQMEYVIRSCEIIIEGIKKAMAREPIKPSADGGKEA